MKDEIILQYQSPSQPCESFVLKTGTFILGRSSKCDFVVKDATISRRHAEITVVDGQVTVKDMASRNGTFVDDERVEQCCVRHGQRLRFGSVPFQLGQASLDAEEPDSDLETKTGGQGSAKSAAMELAEASLSRAQRRVFRLLVDGLSQKKIAGQLTLSAPTVHNHIQAIYGILKVHSRSELLARLLRKEGEPN